MKNNIQRRYTVQRKRIENLVTKYLERGAIIPDALVPPKVKRPTLASVKKLEKITANYIKKNATVIDPNSGVEYNLVSPSGSKIYTKNKNYYENSPVFGLDTDISQPIEIPTFYDTVLYGFETDVIRRMSSPESQDLLQTFYNEAIKLTGPENFAKAVQEAKYTGVYYDKFLAGSDDQELILEGLSELTKSLQLDESEKRKLYEVFEEETGYEIF